MQHLTLSYTDNNTNCSDVVGARVMPCLDGSSGLSTEPLQRPSFLLPEKQAMLEAALAAVQGRRGNAPPYLVDYLHNSADGQGLTQPTTENDVDKKYPCAQWRSIRGNCSHGSRRWLYVRCKRRDCAGCSKVRQWQHASRIANGIRSLGVEEFPNASADLTGWHPPLIVPLKRSCAFIVLTYADARSAHPEFKEEAVRLENSFIRWLRSEQKKLGNNRMEYAKTWEIQPDSQRLHTNIVVGPWMRMDQKEIAARWRSSGLTSEEQKCISLSPEKDGNKRCEINPDPQGILSEDHIHTGVGPIGGWIDIDWVRDDRAVSREATKAQSPDGLGTYLTKVEQMVPEDWHRAISFSKNFPRLTVEAAPERMGEIKWESERDFNPGELMAYQHEKSLGWWLETEKGSGEFYDVAKPEDCNCFDWKPKEIPITDYSFPEIKKPDLDPQSEIQARQLAELYS